jgi:hypothetical protein
VQITLDQETLRPLVKAVVAEVLAELDQVRSTLPTDRLAYSESEAAQMIGLQPWQLRDERRRGRIAASGVVGRRIRYTRSDLERYLADRRVEASA